MLNKISTALVLVFLCAVHTDAQEMQAIRFDSLRLVCSVAFWHF